MRERAIELQITIGSGVVQLFVWKPAFCPARGSRFWGACSLAFIAGLSFRAALFRSLFIKAAAGRTPCRSQLRLTSLSSTHSSDVSRVASYLERQSSGYLESARPSGAKCLTNPLVRFPECSRTHKVEVKVCDVANVEDVEHFTD